MYTIIFKTPSNVTFYIEKYSKPSVCGKAFGRKSKIIKTAVQRRRYTWETIIGQVFEDTRNAQHTRTHAACAQQPTKGTKRSAKDSPRGIQETTVERSLSLSLLQPDAHSVVLRGGMQIFRNAGEPRIHAPSLSLGAITRGLAVKIACAECSSSSSSASIGESEKERESPRQKGQLRFSALMTARRAGPTAATGNDSDSAVRNERKRESQGEA